MSEEWNCDLDEQGIKSSALLSVAERFMRKGRFLEAGQALENLLAKYPSKDKEQIVPLIQLAEVKRELGNFWESEQLAKRALSLKQKHQDFNGFETVLLLLANVVLDQGRKEEAENLFKESRSLFEALYGADHPKVAQTLIDLGDLERLKGNFNQAESLLLSAKKMLQRDPGGMKSLSYVESLNNLGIVYHELKEYEKALTSYREALKVLRSGVINVRLEATVASNLGRLLYQKKYPDLVGAESFIRGALLLREQLGETHPDVAVSLSDLADLCIKLNRFDEARAFLERAIEIQEKVYGTDSARLIVNLQTLGEACLELNCLERAKEHLLRALALRTMEFGEEDSGLEAILQRLKMIFKELGDTKQFDLFDNKLKKLQEIAITKET